MLNRIRSRFVKFVKSRKLNVFSFFLLLSFLFLVVAKLSKTYKDTIVYHIKYANVPEQYSITNEYDSLMKVRVEAYGFHLITHNFYKHKFTVNFEDDIDKADQQYRWSTDKGLSKISADLGANIEVLDIIPDSLKFPFEIMAVKSVPISLNSEIEYSIGYDILDSLIMDPDSVKVIGPKKSIESINKIETTVLKLKDVAKSVDQKVSLELNPKLKDVRLSRKEIKVKGKVEKFTEGTFEVPVNVINLPKDVKINYFPKTVLVSYYVSLENYKKVKALDFKIVCDFNDVKDMDKTFFNPVLTQKPSVVKSARLKQNKIEFILIE